MVLVGIAGGLGVAGCGDQTSATSSNTPKAASPRAGLNESPKVAPPRANSVECWDSTNPIPAYLSNGIIGIRVGRDGSGTGPDGKSLPMFAIDQYQQTGEEKIIPQPTILPIHMKLDGQPILPGSELEYVQIQPLNLGKMELATHWKLGNSTIKSSLLLNQTSNVSSNSSISMNYRFESVKDQVIKFELLSGQRVIASELASINPDCDRATVQSGNRKWDIQIKGGFLVKTIKNYSISLASMAIADSFELTIRGSFVGSTEFDSDKPTQETQIEIEGPIDDQQAVNSFVYYLCSGVLSNSSSPVAPLGLSSKTYNGHVFWDADIWIFPALALIDPNRARSISNYRIRLAGDAGRNFRRKHSWSKQEFIPYEYDFEGKLQYPWESSVSGLEVTPTEARQQHHITGSVLWALGMASDLGIADPKTVNEIGEKAANFYLWRADQVSSTDPKIEGLRTVKNTFSPDEFHFGDDDLYTNCIAESVVRRFSKEYPDIEFLRPRDDNGFLNYSNDRLKGYKQASGVLAIYPLQDPEVEPEAKQMMDRFADKVSKYGPPMTDSVHALIWARLGEKQRAYTTWRKGWKEFTNNPLLLFSEIRTVDVTYFSTGAAGCLQTVLYGFCGIRIDSKAQPGAKWQLPLKNGKVFSIKPNLPKEWKSVRLKNLTILGKKYDVTIRGESVAVSNQPL